MRSKSIGKSELDVFKSYFSEFKDQYVLIGGSATKLLLEEADLSARATKDLDIVLCAKALTKEFVTQFWKFIKSGGYQVKRKQSGNSIFYRFEKPEEISYPYMIELLSEKAEYFETIDQIALPLVVDNTIISLSAIILNQDYYEFLINNKIELDGIVLADERVLIPLKVTAYWDLKNKKARGEEIKGDDIKKHKNDAIRLSMLLTDAPMTNVPSRIKDDMKLFIDEISDEGGLLRNLDIAVDNIESIKNILRKVYGITQ